MATFDILGLPTSRTEALEWGGLMLDAEPRLNEAMLLQDLEQHAFAPSDCPPRIGLEIEMLAFRGIQAATLADFLEACEPLIKLGELVETTTPGAPRCFNYGSIRFTFEPGGQLELISPPRPSAAQALEDILKLEMLLDRVLSWRGIRRASHGVNPWQDESEVVLQTPEPRYLAMQSYFNKVGPEGVRMMRLTCALQVNLDSGYAAEVGERWRLANLMSPILVGVFANSPMVGGKLTGWKSTRARIWLGVDPSRTGYVISSERAMDGAPSYLDFALDAGVLLRRGVGAYRPGRPGFTFREWMMGGDAFGYPTFDDWRYHLTTLFPQVRPRGFLELRSMDTPPVRWRAVPVAVASALLLDPTARADATALLEDHRGDLAELAEASARQGVADARVGLVARRLMELAIDALPRLPEGWITPAITADVYAFYSLFTVRGRCPADELLDLQARGHDAASLARAASDDGWSVRSERPW